MKKGEKPGEEAKASEPALRRAGAFITPAAEAAVLAVEAAAPSAMSAAALLAYAGAATAAAAPGDFDPAEAVAAAAAAAAAVAPPAAPGLIPRTPPPGLIPRPPAAVPQMPRFVPTTYQPSAEAPEPYSVAQLPSTPRLSTTPRLPGMPYPAQAPPQPSVTITSVTGGTVFVEGGLCATCGHCGALVVIPQVPRMIPAHQMGMGPFGPPAPQGYRPAVPRPAMPMPRPRGPAGAPLPDASTDDVGVPVGKPMPQSMRSAPYNTGANRS